MGQGTDAGGDSAATGQPAGAGPAPSDSSGARLRAKPCDSVRSDHSGSVPARHADVSSRVPWRRIVRLWARSRGQRSGRACPLCPGTSDVNLFRYRKGIIHLNSEVPDSALDFGMAEQS
jgi:hypothetical protein